MPGPMPHARSAREPCSNSTLPSTLSKGLDYICWINTTIHGLFKMFRYQLYGHRGQSYSNCATFNMKAGAVYDECEPGLRI